MVTTVNAASRRLLTAGWANSVTSLSAGGDTVATRVGLTPTGLAPMCAGLFHPSRRPVFATFVS